MGHPVFGVLTNGLNVAIYPKEETSAIGIWVFARGGSDYETKENNGIHHFLEHMYFQGTKKRPESRNIWTAIEGNGGEMNGQTDRESVGYTIEMNYKDLELGIELCADILFNSCFDPDAIEKERKVILEEKKMGEDDVRSKIYSLWDEDLYPDCAWGFPIIGSEENIRSLNRDTLIACMKTHYRANTMVLAVAGKVDPNEVLALAQKYFSKLKNKKKLVSPLGVDSQNSPRAFLHYKETEITHLMLGFRGYDLFNPLKTPFELLGIILGGNSSSRLFTSIRGERGLAYAVTTHNGSYTNRGEIATYVGVDHANLREAIHLIIQEHKNIVKDGVSEEELNSAKKYALGRMVRDLERSSNLAAFIGLKKLFSEPNLTPEDEMDEVEKTTVEEVNKAARDIFRENAINLLVIGPHKNRQRLSKLLKL